MKRFFLDVETTNLDSKVGGIWQLAGILEIDGKVVDKINFFMNPKDVEYSDEALEVGKITREEINKFDSHNKCFSDFIEFLDKYIDRFDSKDKLLFCAYVAKFDEGFLRAWFLRNEHKYFGSYFFSNTVDVYNLVGYVTMNMRHRIKSFSLVDICKLFNIEIKGAHDAFNDITATIELLNVLERDHLTITV